MSSDKTGMTENSSGQLWELIADLYDDDVDTQTRAAEALGRLRDPAAVEPLVWLLHDGQREGDGVWDERRVAGRLRDAVAWALGEIGDPRAVGPLIAAAEFTALARIGAAAVQPLIDAMQNADAWRVRCAASALGEIGDPRAVEPLIAAVRHGNCSAEAAAASALGQIGDPRAVEPLIAALGSGFHDKRAAAASALVALGPAAVEPLSKAVRTTDASKREAAAAALTHIGDPRAVEPLIDSLRYGSGGPWLRRPEVESIAQMGPRIIAPATRVLMGELRSPPAQEGRWARWCRCHVAAWAIELCIPAVVDAPDTEREEATEALRAARRALRGALWPWSRVPRDVKRALRDLLRAMDAAGLR